MVRKIAVITGSRAEFGVLIPIIKEINNDKRLSLTLIATGMHFQKKHGYTINNIKKEGFDPKYKVRIIGESDTHFDITQSVGKGIIKFSRIFENDRPDIVLITGDRTEQLSATIAASILRIPIAHYVGGERTMGGIDESIRHAITKFSNIHFAKTEESRKRIIKMGENPKYVFCVGFSGIDYIVNQKLFSKEETYQKFDLNLKRKLILILQHPISTDSEKARMQIKETLKAALTIDAQKIIIYPNSDPGSKEMIKLIDDYAKKEDFKAYSNLPYNEYLSLIKYANVVIGNSSGALVETVPFKTPVINIGKRQDGRERTRNVIDATYNSKKIILAIKKIESKSFQTDLKNIKNPFGKGDASKQIALILSKLPLKDKILRKQITY